MELMIIDFSHLHIINIPNIIAVLGGGITMGVYLVLASRCAPSFVTLVTLGWSFILPLGVTQVMIEAVGVDLDRVFERMLMWMLFAGAARLTVNKIVWHKTRKLQKP